MDQEVDIWRKKAAEVRRGKPNVQFAPGSSEADAEGQIKKLVRQYPAWLRARAPRPPRARAVRRCRCALSAEGVGGRRCCSSRARATRPSAASQTRQLISSTRNAAPYLPSAGCLVCCHAALRQRAVQIGCNYETVDTLDEENNPGLREALKAFSQWPTIPQLYVGGEFMGGADVAREMHESGELKQAVAEALQARAAAAADFVTLCQAHHSPPQPVSPGPQHQGNYSRLVLGHTGAGG